MSAVVYIVAGPVGLSRIRAVATMGCYAVIVTVTGGMALFVSNETSSIIIFQV